MPLVVEKTVNNSSIFSFPMAFHQHPQSPILHTLFWSRIILLTKLTPSNCEVPCQCEQPCWSSHFPFMVGWHWCTTLALCFSHLLLHLQHFCAVDYSGHAVKQGPFKTKMPLPTAAESKPAHRFWLHTGSGGQNLDWTGSIFIFAFVFFLVLLYFFWALSAGTSRSPNNPVISPSSESWGGQGGEVQTRKEHEIVLKPSKTKWDMCLDM